MVIPQSAARLWRPPVCPTAVLLVWAGFAGPVCAGPLSFDDALALAVRETPVLRAESAQIDAARQAAIPAGALPDPKLALGIDNLPIEGPDRFSLSRDFMTMRRIGLMQDFPNAAKRDARVAAARGRVAQAEAQTRITRLMVLRETALAWIARDAVERQLAGIDALVEENRVFEASVRARIAGGKGSALEAVAPRQEAALIEARRDELGARRRQAVSKPLPRSNAGWARVQRRPSTGRRRTGPLRATRLNTHCTGIRNWRSSSQRDACWMPRWPKQKPTRNRTGHWNWRTRSAARSSAIWLW